MNVSARYLLPILVLTTGSAALPQAPMAPPEPTPILGARMPGLSPDGQRLAFVYRGDLWIAPAEGGRAQPLTRHVDMDAYPLFSPEGKWVAFASKRNGNWDIFLIPAEGGVARQLTWHGGSDVAYGWRPDGNRLLFSAKRDTVNYSLFALDPATLRCDKLMEDYATINYPNYAPDGQTVVYGRYGLSWTRPRYLGSAAAQIWLLHVADGQRRPLTSDDRQHLWTRFLPDGQRLLTVTVGESTPSSSRLGETIPKITDNPRRTPNLWIFDLQGRGTPLTTFSGGAVRWPTVAAKSGDIAFEYGPDLWRLPAGQKEPVKLRFYVAADEKQNSRRREKLTTGVMEVEPSPDGKTVAFGLRGEIWTVLADKPKGVEGRSAEFARRLTDWAGDDSDFVWSHDGKKLFFTSNREFNQRLYELVLETLEVKPLWQRPEDVTRLNLSPDGKQLAFWVSGPEGGLYVLPIAGGEARRLVKVPGPQLHGYGGGDCAWSHDLRWLAYTQRSPSRAWNVYIVPAAGGEAINVTRLNAHHSQPAWSPDGKYLFFQSNRDGDGLYLLPLVKEPSRSVDFDLKFEKPKDPVKVDIDFEDIWRRCRRFVSQNPQADLQVTAEGQMLFLSDGDVWSVAYDGKETKRLTTGGGKAGLRATKDGKKAFFIQNGELQQMKIADGKPEKVSFTADWERDVQAERQAAFTQFWHTFQRGFYDPNFHGRNWEAIRQDYAPRLEAVETHEEFSTLLNMMVGELETSHAEVTAAPGSVPEPVTPHLGFTFDYQYPGPGLRIAKVPDGAPGAYAKTQLKEGEYVLALNGQDLTLDEKLYQRLNDKQDREFEFLVNSKPVKAGARTVKYKVLTPEEWAALNARNRTERLRQYVEGRSSGQIGYLHISAMDATNQTQFEHEVYEYIGGKKAMIMDVRFNRGGNISDTLIDWLERKQHGFFRPRDGEPEPSPARAWDKSIIVLLNEHSYSNGEMFPCALRQRGLARLVGMPTPGYVIWTWPMKLVDGTGARLPASGVYRLNGTPQENLGEEPDVRVPLSPDDWLADRDPQLDKALELLQR